MPTFLSITANGTTVNFDKLGDAGPRYFLDFIPNGPQYDYKRFRAPGWNGNALIRGGYTGQQLVFNARYQGALSTINNAWKADRDLFSQYNCVINDIGDSLIWSRCTLRPDSAIRTSDELAYGPGGTKFFSVRYVFDVEEYY